MLGSDRFSISGLSWLCNLVYCYRIIITSSDVEKITSHISRVMIKVTCMWVLPKTSLNVTTLVSIFCSADQRLGSKEGVRVSERASWTECDKQTPSVTTETFLKAWWIFFFSTCSVKISLIFIVWSRSCPQFECVMMYVLCCFLSTRWHACLMLMDL